MKIGPALNERNLVFGYDTGYDKNNINLSNRRYFKGSPRTNLLERLNTSYSNTQNANFYAVAGTETVKIPKVGIRNVKYVEYFNNYPSGGTCCPNLFNYGEASVSPSTSYTYSIIYKHTGDYTHPNFMYRYEYNGGTYNTEGGFHSTASDRRTPLGDGWYHAWGTFTTQSTTNLLVCYSFLYNYGTTKYKFYVAGISIVQNISGGAHLITPPQLMVEPGATISSTESLIDLTRTSTIDVSNVSFDSNGVPTFDGTDDYITTTGFVQPSDPNNFSVEAVVNLNAHNSNTNIGSVIVNNYSSLRGWIFYLDGPDSRLGLRHHYNGTSGAYSIEATTGINLNQWYHIMGTDDGTTVRLYVNGVQVQTGSSSTATNYSGQPLIGQFPGNNAVTNGKIPVVKIYDRSLTAREIKANFNQYKNRFGM